MGPRVSESFLNVLDLRVQHLLKTDERTVVPLSSEDELTAQLRPAHSPGLLTENGSLSGVSDVEGDDAQRDRGPERLGFGDPHIGIER